MIMRVLEMVEKTHGSFDEEDLREFYKVFGDTIKIIVKYTDGNREKMAISEFYNLSKDYYEYEIKEVFLWSEDYQKLMEIKSLMKEF